MVEWDSELENPCSEVASLLPSASVSRGASMAYVSPGSVGAVSAEDMVIELEMSIVYQVWPMNARKATQKQQW